MTREAKLADGYFAEQEKRLSDPEHVSPEPERESREIAPLSEGLDPDEVERLILALDGNVSEIAEALHVRRDRLRAFIDQKPGLKRAMGEVFEGAVDEAVGVLFKGLRDPASFQNRFYAAKAFLQSEAGRKRGFGREPGLAATLEVKSGDTGKTIILKWIEPDSPSLDGRSSERPTALPAPKIIEGETS